jgi:hypothetical protein
MKHIKNIILLFIPNFFVVSLLALLDYKSLGIIDVLTNKDTYFMVFLFILFELLLYLAYKFIKYLLQNKKT